MQNNVRKQIEQDHYDARARGEYIRAVNVYDQAYLDYLTEQSFAWIGPLENRRILYYGCGLNWDTADRFRSSGAQTVMIDLSYQSVRMLAHKIVKEEADKELTVLQMDCERLGFRDRAFDIVYGRAILHHLDTDEAAREIARVLRPGGRAVFQEPLNMNLFINLFRRLTPRWRTPTEHPLSFADLKAVGQHFRRMTHIEFGLTAIVGVIVNGLLEKVGIAPRNIMPLLHLDAFLLRCAPWLRRLCWGTLIVLEQ